MWFRDTLPTSSRGFKDTGEFTDVWLGLATHFFCSSRFLQVCGITTTLFCRSCIHDLNMIWMVPWCFLNGVYVLSSSLYSCLVYHRRINLLNSSGRFFSWLHHSKVVGICDNSGSAGVADSGAIPHFDLHLSGLILFHCAVFSHPVSCQNGLNFGDTPFDELFLVLFQDQKLWIDIDSFSSIMSDVSRWFFWPKLGHETDRVGVYYRFYYL